MNKEEKFNILIVDDRPENLLALESILESPDLNIIKANSGNEALGLLLEYEVSLVLLDVQMPGMDGFETAELMRSNERTKNIPIIFVTAISKQRKHVFKGYEKGAVDYLYKPLDLEILKSKVKAFIEFFKHKKALEQTTKKLQETVKELNKAKKAAEQATRYKTQFLANMSHEIRTPLNGIIGIADLGLMDEDLTPLQKERLNDIKNSGESLLDIINDILDISKIEAGKLEIEEEEFSIRELLEKVFSIISFRTVKGLNEIVCRISPDMPDVLMGDPLRLRQVLLNLLTNATKFTHNGTIILTVEKLELIEEQLRVRFTVEDTGIGIPKEKIPTIFDTYTQAHRMSNSEDTGTGLGLFISQRLTRLMGGNISLESEVGKGSKFYFTLNMVIGNQVKDYSKLKLHGDKKDINILYLDSHPQAREVVEEYLKFWGLKVKTAENRDDLTQVLSNSDNKCTHVFVEIPLNEDPGKLIPVVNDIKKKAINVILVTETKNARYVDQIRKKTHCSLITKPIMQQRLKEILEEKQKDHKEKEEKPAFFKGQEPSNNITILVAEDQEINMKIVLQLLSRKGYKTIPAKNGKVAVELYKEHQGKIDLILMDVQMPLMSGVDATKAIRELELVTAHHVPIIAMTAHAMKGDKEKFLASGMDDYISKPVHPDVLYSVVTKNISVESH
jgi:signal transduction histidine kinase